MKKIIVFFRDFCIAHLLNFFRKKQFLCAGQSYPYFYHRRNRTWLNERTIELPLIHAVLQKYQGKRILEIGNVTSRYYKTNHLVIDKYEKRSHIQNHDVVDFKPDEPYDLIISISTLEHVGFDEDPFYPEKVLDAFQIIRNFIHPNGEIHVTLPSGYNTHLDDYIDQGKIPFAKTYCFKRISEDNLWQEVEWKDISHNQYSKEKNWHSNGLLYGVLYHPDRTRDSD